MAVWSVAESPFPKYYGHDDPGFDAAVAEEAKTDFSIVYHNDDKMTIGIGEVKDGIMNSIRFTFEELRHFWETQRHKDFIVVTLDKSMRTEAEDKALVQRLTDYFFEVGFRRVRIHQGLGSGVGVLSDEVNPKSGRP